MENEEMKIPLDNKEVLPKSETMRVSTRKYRLSLIANVVLIITAFFTMAVAFVPVMETWLKSKEKLILEEAEFDRRVEEVNKKWEREEAIRLQEQAYINIGMIIESLNALRHELPNSSRINISYAHDSGGVPVSGTSLNRTILFSANNIEPCLGRDYWQNRVFPVGYFNLYSKIYFEHFVYIPNIQNEPEIFIKETKEDFECDDIKSYVGMVLKKTPFGVYYISVTWQHQNALDLDKWAVVAIRKYSAQIEPLIQEKRLL